VSSDFGRVILLNGASSSGKSTVANAVRHLIGHDCAVLSIDYLHHSVRPSHPASWKLYFSLTTILAQTAAAHAYQGFDVVVDTVLEREECFDAFVSAVSPIAIFMVRVDCPVDVLIKRELERANRRHGLAADHAGRVHKGYKYDASVDTSVMTPEHCAKVILDALA